MYDRMANSLLSIQFLTHYIMTSMLPQVHTAVKTDVDTDDHP